MIGTVEKDSDSPGRNSAIGLEASCPVAISCLGQDVPGLAVSDGAAPLAAMVSTIRTWSPPRSPRAGIWEGLNATPMTLCPGAGTWVACTPVGVTIVPAGSVVAANLPTSERSSSAGMVSSPVPTGICTVPSCCSVIAVPATICVRMLTTAWFCPPRENHQPPSSPPIASTAAARYSERVGRRWRSGSPGWAAAGWAAGRVTDGCETVGPASGRRGAGGAGVLVI